MDKALANVVVEAYIRGVSTCKIEALVQQMGVERVDKSAVSRLSKELDDDVEASRQRSLDERYVYVWLDGHVPQGARGRTCGVHGAHDGGRPDGGW